MDNIPYHIIFDNSYFNNVLGHRSRNHPTWNLEPLDGIKIQFGGRINARLNRLISFNSDFIVNGNNVSGLTFGINFEDFFNAQINGKYLFYRHAGNNDLASISGEIKIAYPYSNYPLKPTEAYISRTPSEFVNQKWVGNCNRIGGDPIWVQQPEFLTCPICESTMQFVFQLDSGLPDLNERNNYEIMFGNDGICYAFWCSRDHISGYLWQCT